ncbi:hypothetical protein GCM10023340_07280 [Nocardioides marinquilinus]|uniref:Uncharacterized protein n=1 Tax=Nocardioides marinquilinus TaxID=1210400 RepID=A0ABP9PB88_9ACTN
MTDEHEHEQAHAGESPRDEALRERLRAADPAASLPAADPDRVARLLEDTMTDQLTDESRTDGTRNRSRLTWLVAAAAVVLIAGGLAFVFLGGGDDEPDVAGGDPTPSATTGSSSAASAAPTSTLTLGFDESAASGRCVAPDSAAALQVLEGQQLAFDGTVESVSGTRVTLVPQRFYAGDEVDRVVVEAPGAQLRALLAAVRFQEDGRYLVSASDGRVTLCGLSGAYDDALAAQYEKAFGG